MTNGDLEVIYTPIFDNKHLFRHTSFLNNPIPNNDPFSWLISGSPYQHHDITWKQTTAAAVCAFWIFQHQSLRSARCVRPVS